MTTELLKIDKLSVEFNTPFGWRQVTHDVSFEIQAGRTLALVGESGSGKSVTSMSILNLLPPNTRRSGSIFFDGRDLTSLPEKELRQLRGSKIATIFQEPMTAMNPVYTIGRQLIAALKSHRSLSRDEARSRALDLLKKVHMPNPETKLDAYPHQLSGGQRQRAMIAMAISSEPDLLIADEPTTALDVTVQAEILELIRDLQKRLDMAVLIVTHDMGVVADIADDVVVMKDGQIVETAPVMELFSDPKNEYTRKLLSSVPRLGHAQGFLSAANLLPARQVRETSENVQVLSFSNATISYPGKWRKPGFQAVKELDLEVSRGEIVGLVGESGSGKSTIGKAVVGLVPVTRGKLEVVNREVDSKSILKQAEIRRHVSMVFQDPASSLNPRRTIGQAIADPLKWLNIINEPSKRRQRARELLEQVHINPDWYSRYPHELSGGQRQRIGIARAIGTDPSLMIADEPTSALDVSVQVEVLELFLALQRDMGFACLFISHDLSVVEALADRVVVLRNGTIAEEGTTEEVLTTPTSSYTQRLLEAAPVPDPELQRHRRMTRSQSPVH